MVFDPPPPQPMMDIRSESIRPAFSAHHHLTLSWETPEARESKSLLEATLIALSTNEFMCIPL